MLGIRYQDLQQFIYQAKQRHQAIQTQKEQTETRLIAKGGGRKASLSQAEQIVLTLAYLRQHLTFQMLGLLFDVSESTAHNIFNGWLPIADFTRVKYIVMISPAPLIKGGTE
jgi:hypothetical protein